MFTPTGTRRRGVDGGFVRWNLNVPAELADRFEKLHNNPAYRKPLFGSKSQVVCHLLAQYVASIENEIAAVAREMLGGNAA